MPNTSGPKSGSERKAFVLLSGGLDSTTCLYKAIYDYNTEDTQEEISLRIIRNGLNQLESAFDPITWVEAVSIDYGQRHIKEASYAKKTCDKLGIVHTTLNLRDILGGAMLTDRSVDIPDVSYSDLPHGVSPTYVPFRNGTLLSLITAHAQKWINQQNAIAVPKDKGTAQAGVYFGAHSEDAQNWAYPDCTPEFIGAMANAIYIGSYNQIRLHTPLQWLMKDEIVALGEILNVPFEDTWSCYKGEPLHCGTCPTCRSRKDAFVKAGAIDPTEYANDPHDVF